MIERVSRPLAWGLALCALAGLPLLAGCDNTVNIKTVTIQLQSVHPVAASYTPVEVGGLQTCDVNPDSLDVQLLLLGNTKARGLRQILDGDRLEDCRFELGQGEDGQSCYLDSESVRLLDSKAQRLSQVCTRATDCEDGWTCNFIDKVCERPLPVEVLQAREEPARTVDYVQNGRSADGAAASQNDKRLVALIVDNSGSLRGNDSDGGLSTRTPTDSADERVAAAQALLGTLNPSHDLVAVYKMAGYGDSGVSNVGLAQINEDTDDDLRDMKGFYRTAAGFELLDDALTSLAGSEGGGTPIWEAIVKAADDMREVANLAHWSPAIVVITDGYRKQDKTLADGARQEDGNLENGAQVVDVLGAVQNGVTIPVYIVHLENVALKSDGSGSKKVYTVLGRDADLAEIACASGGAYYRVTKPTDLKGPLERFFSHLTVGHYLMRLGYQALQMDDKYPAGEDYAITATFRLTLGATEKTFSLAQGTIPGGRSYDARVYVTKP